MRRLHHHISGLAAKAWGLVSSNQCMHVIVPEQVIETYAGPAVELDGRGHLINANIPGHSFIESVHAGEHASLEISILVAQASLKRQVRSGRVRLNTCPQMIDQSFGENDQSYDPGLGAKTYDVLILPCAGAVKNVLLVARDITADVNLMMALTASRELYRDLVVCQADFSWETDSHGAFIYVNQRGAFGYSASELNGLLVTALLHNTDLNGAALEGATPFTTNKPIEDVEVWLKGKSGRDICALISALPVFDKNNSWRGARGVGKDVTELRKHEKERQRNQLLNDAVSQVVTAMRVELDPKQIIVSATQAILQATGAALAWIQRIDEGGDFQKSVDLCGCVSARSHKRQDVFPINSVVDQFNIVLKEALAQGKKMSTASIGTRDLLGVFTEHHGSVNGALIVAQPILKKGWETDTIDLLAKIGAHAGIAIAQANQTQLLQDLSSKDPLTGLMNRRAFMDLAAQRMAQHVRHQRQAGFVYIDVDNFKKINDEIGHGEGDRLLMRIGEDLQSCVRPSDLVVRLGGDEFGVFLEECDYAALQSSAERIFSLRSHKIIAPLPESAGGLSLGLTLFDPYSNERLDHLIHRADDALYAAKLKGKNQWALAPPVILNEMSGKGRAITC